MLSPIEKAAALDDLVEMMSDSLFWIDLREDGWIVLDGSGAVSSKTRSVMSEMLEECWAKRGDTV
jgi:hypothetical protein